MAQIFKMLSYRTTVGFLFILCVIQLASFCFHLVSEFVFLSLKSISMETFSVVHLSENSTIIDRLCKLRNQANMNKFSSVCFHPNVHFDSTGEKLVRWQKPAVSVRTLEIYRTTQFATKYFSRHSGLLV